jgi:3-dehydroquinate dehydratase II
MSNARHILILNGPNLNLLGTREPAIYGTTTLEELRKSCEDKAKTLGVSLDFRQTNDEAELIGWIQQAKADAMLINAAAFTHTSVAIHDALKSFKGPIVEVHLSNIYARESFRHTSYVSPLAVGVLCGFGVKGYTMALEFLAERF